MVNNGVVSTFKYIYDNIILLMPVLIFFLKFIPRLFIFFLLFFIFILIFIIFFFLIIIFIFWNFINQFFFFFNQFILVNTKTISHHAFNLVGKYCGVFDHVS